MNTIKNYANKDNAKQKEEQILLLYSISFCPLFVSFPNKSLLCANFKVTMQQQETKERYNYFLNDFHSESVGFSVSDFKILT